MTVKGLIFSSSVLFSLRNGTKDMFLGVSSFIVLIAPIQKYISNTKNKS